MVDVSPSDRNLLASWREFHKLPCVGAVSYPTNYDFVSLFVGVFTGATGFRDIWRWLVTEPLGSFPKLSITDDAVRKAIQRWGSQTFANLYIHLCDALPKIKIAQSTTFLATFATEIVALDESTLDAIHRHRQQVRHLDPGGCGLSACNARGTMLSRSNHHQEHEVMADQGQVELIKRSTHEWNVWRQEHPEIPADFSGADFSHANLSYAALSAVNLDGTNFHRTVFQGTLFAWVDLSLVKELETARHNGPSIVDINSVTLPHDEYTRNHFLCGIGFTETQIEYLPSLLAPRPIQYQSLFISNAHQDEAIAQQLYTSLRKKDVPCWFARHDLQPGNYYRQGIDQAIHTQDRVLLLLSEHSVQSGWVRYEVELALARENDQQREILYPIRLDQAIFDCTANWARSLRATRHIGDFTGWQDEAFYQQAFSTLLRHLKVTQPPTNRTV